MMADGFVSGTPGQQLRAAREARGADMVAAHEGTKIPQPLLEALERDEYHKLSGPLYVRSFLRNYGEWLGLDVDGLLRAYESLSGGSMAGGGEDMVWSEETVEVKRVGGGGLRRDVMLVTAGVLGVIVVALVIWWFAARGESEPPSEPATTSEVSDQAPSAEVAPGPETAGARSAPATAMIQPAEGDESAAARLARLEADSLTVALHPATPSNTPALPAAVPANGRVPFVAGVPVDLVLRVLLPAPANCSVKCDRQQAARPVVWPTHPRPLPTTDVEPGVAYAVAEGFAVYWGADDTFTLTLGDLRGATAHLNDRDLPVSQWKPGQPVVLDQHILARMGG